MENRRQFLKQVGIATAGVLILPNLGCLAKESTKKFGIQLYSLRNELPNNVEKVISEIAKAGYSFVETYGYSLEGGFWGLKPADFKNLLDKYNLASYSGHYDFNVWEQTQDEKILKSYIDAAKQLGQKYIVVPYINPEIYKSEATTRAFAKKLNKAAKIVKDGGLKLAYHNHDIEFYPLPGNKNGFTILLEELSADLVDFEMDLYWVVRAKLNPVDLIKKYPGRFTMWHIKDMSKVNPSKNTEIGNGSIDFKAIFKEAKLSGLKYPLVEQENFDINPYDSINKSAIYIKSLS